MSSMQEEIQHRRVDVYCEGCGRVSTIKLGRGAPPWRYAAERLRAASCCGFAIGTRLESLPDSSARRRELLYLDGERLARDHAR